MTPSPFFLPATGPLNQGDILIAPIARVVVNTMDAFTPDKWDRVDQATAQIPRNEVDGTDIFLAAGRELLMVTSHDCHHDKEWNQEVRRLEAVCDSVEEAKRIASADLTLDRSFQASPLVPLDDLPETQRGNYRSGRVVGYFPVPAAPDGSFPESVVDLTYRATIDVLAIDNRRFGISNLERARLRLALSTFDALRTAAVGPELEAAIGKRITKAAVDRTDRISVALTLEDGTELRLLQQPAEPDPGGRSELITRQRPEG